MEKEITSGKTVIDTKEILKTIRYQDRENSPSKTRTLMKASGKTICFMVKELLL